MKRLPKPDGSPALRGGGAPRSPRIASYTIEARLDASNHQISGSEKLIWTNAGQSPVDTLPFHLYLNAFKNEQSDFMRSSRGEMRGAHASDTGWGWIQVDSIKIGAGAGGEEQVAKLRYPKLPDETVVELPLAEPVQPGSSIEVSINFTEQLPEVFARTGYKNEFHLVGQWFPKVGVRVGPPGAERWECQPLSVNTEFFADFGTYDVKLTVPSTYVVAATGVLSAAIEAPGQTRTYTYHAEDVHDFVWMADPYMVVDRTTGRTPYIGQAKLEDGSTVEVRVYARQEQERFARRHLQAAIGAIERFSNYFVPYPWPIMTVIDPPVDAADGAGGMEYPTLVTTSGDSVFTRNGIRLPEYTTVHEVGHNWFQGILASNEPVEAWLDEGVNTWADNHVMQDLYGPRGNGFDWGGWQADSGWIGAALVADEYNRQPSPIATAAYAFVDNEAYGLVEYLSTADALTTLEKHVGSAKFLAAMKAYTKEFAFKHPTGNDLFTVLERELGDLSWYLGPAFQSVGGHRLEIRTAKCDNKHEPRGVFGDAPNRKTKTETEAPDSGTFICEVVLENTGPVHIPVEVEFKFADGSSKREVWDDRGNGNWKRWLIERSSELVEVRVDPDRKIMFENPVGYWRRLEGDDAASMRAAARMASWTQTLMQFVGP